MNYLLCFTNRSGSSHLCALLESAGLGEPFEYFNTVSYAKYAQSKSHQEYLDFVLHKQGRVAGVKINWDSINFMQEIHGPEFHQRFDKIICLFRRDKLEQAISWYRASQTRQWSCFDDKQQEAEYDQAAIQLHLSYINGDEECLMQWLEGKQYLQLYYEDLTDQSVYDIASYLEVNVTSVPTSLFTIQRDHITQEWKERFLASKNK